MNKSTSEHGAIANKKPISDILYECLVEQQAQKAKIWKNGDPLEILRELASENRRLPKDFPSWPLKRRRDWFVCGG